MVTKMPERKPTSKEAVMNKKVQFIKSKDAETVSELRKLGFIQVDETDGVSTFLNNSSFNFEENKNLKVTFSNILCV